MASSGRGKSPTAAAAFSQEGKSPGLGWRAAAEQPLPNSRQAAAARACLDPLGGTGSQTLGSTSSQAGVTATGFPLQPPSCHQPARQERCPLPREAAFSFSPKRAAEVWDHSHSPQGCPFLTSRCRSPCRAWPRCWRALLQSIGTQGRESPAQGMERSRRGWEQPGPASPSLPS